MNLRLVALDLLRFCAAFAVLMYHYTARDGSTVSHLLSDVSKFGYLGVPLFFIISGYVIILSAKNKSASEFAVSRFVRLYPAFWAGIFITSLITYIFGASEYSISQILANMTMFNDYLGFKNIDGVYWTLQAELKFYGCVFVLLLLGIFDRFKLWLSGWISLTMFSLLTGHPSFMGWFISPHYSSFFIAGVAFYLIHKDGENVYNITVLLLSLFVSSLRGFDHVSEFMTRPSMADKVVAVFIIWSFYLLFYLLVTNRIRCSKRKLYFTLGGLTYPLYLIHSIAGKTIIDYFKSVMPEWTIIIAVTLLVLSVSYLVHVYIERKFSSPMKSILLSWLSGIPSLTSKS